MMSCNGCRVLRKGCSESCILRPCLQWIEHPESQGHATVFVAKFFGRAGLMSFISAVSENQRPALFQSLLFEACGRTVNPVNGAVGLLWTSNWHVCQAAVETVLRGGVLQPMMELFPGDVPVPVSDEASQEVTCTEIWKVREPQSTSRLFNKRKKLDEKKVQQTDLDLRLSPGLSKVPPKFVSGRQEMETPSMNSEESMTTTCYGGNRYADGEERKLLNLFI